MISNSFEEFSYVLPYPPRLLPTRLDFSAYKHILELEIFPTAVWNSVVNTCVTVVLSVFISTLSAYGFARIQFPGRDKLFGIYLFTLMMPGFLNIIPQFLILKGIPLPGLTNGLIGTRAGLILVYVATNVCGHTFSCGISSEACRILYLNRSLSTAADTARSFSKSCCPFPNRRSGL